MLDNKEDYDIAMAENAEILKGILGSDTPLTAATNNKMGSVLDY